MKQMIINALVSLFTGFFLVVGLGGGALVVGLMYEKLKDEPQKRFRPRVFSKPLPQSAIIETTVVRDVPSFTVRGSLRNSGNEDWDIPEIKVEILSKGVVVTTCDDVREWRIVKPGQTTNFLIVCRNIGWPATGENLDYRVTAFQFVDQSK
jgi:hypothetical protein